ncbi:MAG TPA: hypothetical protein PK264_18040, partial [Hyphomicrobiaceae bacterium]|nr:hypothetical protein [Hyphomicrobiaceae bacterium]
MRVQNPVRFAEVLLGEDKGWSPDRIKSLISGGPMNNQITLTKKIPVHITYFTAHVSDDGKVSYKPDIYGHEERILLGIDGKFHLIPKPAPAPDPVAVARAAGPPVAKSKYGSNNPGFAGFFNGLFGN